MQILKLLKTPPLTLAPSKKIVLILLFISFAVVYRPVCGSNNFLNYNQLVAKKDSIRILKELVFDTASSVIYIFEKRTSIADGHWTIKYNNGKVKEDFIIKNGRLNGNLFWYWPNGSLMYKAKFENNIIQKYWYVYGTDNKLTKKYIYDEYERPEKLYQYNGKCLNSVTYFKNGVESHTKSLKCDK
ncbi:MAG: toxin-antitoxin system YwqK family antitoxin [Mucilaginibacter sp.]